MVGGTWRVLFGEMDPRPLVDRVRLKSIPFSQGFRPFAYDEFKSEVVGAALARKPGGAARLLAVGGYFYDKADPAKDLAAGLAELVDDYRRGSRWEQGGLDV